MTSIIKETQSIKDAVTCINTIDVNKFSRLISRIIQKLHLKEERTFSEEEEQKLQTALSLDKQALSLVLETSAFILEQAVYHNVKPASLQQQLEAVHLNPDKAEVFSQIWSTNGPELVEKLKHNTFAPRKLEYIGWQLNLQMAQSSQARLKSPSAVLQLGLHNENSEVQENVFVEFNHQKLLEFYNKVSFSCMYVCAACMYIYTLHCLYTQCRYRSCISSYVILTGRHCLTKSICLLSLSILSFIFLILTFSPDFYVFLLCTSFFPSTQPFLLSLPA
uniref:COMM domain containing 10 n=1 Tax=Mastacembelus armatus TaxID=205130 RepID=A0A3Q3MKE1_9TELE